MYRIVYALPQEENNFDIIYNAKENIELSFDQEIGVNFIKSIENNLTSPLIKCKKIDRYTFYIILLE